MSEFKRILVAIDFSNVSINALKVANNLAKQLKSKLDVVHTVPIKATDLSIEAGANYIQECLEKDLASETDELKQFIHDHIGKDVDIECHVHSGDPVTEINQTAEEIHANIIVMGTHGRTGLKHLLVGSVAESILRESNIPVMCIRSE